MKKTNKQDFVGQSDSNLDEAIQKAISQGKIDAERYKVIEITGSQQTNNKKQYQVVLSERDE